MMSHCESQTLLVVASFENGNEAAFCKLTCKLLQDPGELYEILVRQGEITQGIAQPAVEPCRDDDQVRTEVLHLGSKGALEGGLDFIHA